MERSSSGSSGIAIPRKSSNSLSGARDVSGLSASPHDSMMSSIPLTVENESVLEFRTGCTPPVHEDFTQRMKNVSLNEGQDRSHVQTDAAMIAAPISRQVQERNLQQQNSHSGLATVHRFAPSQNLIQQTFETQNLAFTNIKQQQSQPGNAKQQSPKSKYQAKCDHKMQSASIVSQPEKAEYERYSSEKVVGDIEQQRKEKIDKLYAEERYKMDHPQRGQALIFSFSSFEEETFQTERKGSDQEAQKTQQLLQILGFKVDLHINKTKIEVEKILATVAANNHTDDDCFMCFFMSHGFEGRWFPEPHLEERTDLIFATDAHMFVDDLLTPFRDNSSPTLAGKPKLFFIQACRGTKASEKVQINVAEKNEMNSLLGTQRNPRQPQEHEEKLEEKVDGSVMKQRDKAMTYTCLNHPAYKDYLVAHSTLPGYFSFRKNSGSWFIRQLWYQLKEGCDTLDINEILERVNLVVAYSYEADTAASTDAQTCALHGKGQMPWIMSMLTKDVYLKPKVPGNTAALQHLRWDNV